MFEMHDGWGWWMVFGWIWMVMFWGAVVTLIVWVVNRIGASSGGATRDPLDIAKERLARGEIDEDEFRRLREHLS
jgi:putative membrane protein